MAGLAGLLFCQSWPLATASLFAMLGGSHPILLVALNGGIAAVAVAAAFSHSECQALFLPVISSLPLWLAIDTTSWWVGRRFGPTASEWLVHRRPRLQVVRRSCERLLDRHRFAVVAGAFAVPVPTVLIHAGCGWRRMPLQLFLTADTLNILARNVVFALVGHSVKAQATAVVDAINRDIGSAGTLIMFAAVAAVLLRHRHGTAERARDHPKDPAPPL